MQVQAINNVSSLNFEGKTKKSQEKKNIENINPQMDTVASKQSVKSMRNLVYGLMLLGAAAGSTMTTSCVKAESESGSSAEAYAYAWGAGCNCGGVKDTTIIHDTIINTIVKPIYLKEFPGAICDSLISQGLNIGVPLDGPVPNGTDNVVFLASKAFNRYDQKFYETKIDSAETNKNQLSLRTKILDFYEDPENPKTIEMKTNIRDIKGKGIQFNRYILNENGVWKFAYSEIRSNGARGNTPGENRVYDGDGNMIWKGTFSKGQEAGTFQFGTLALDSDGNIYYDEDGNPEIADYDFNHAQMWSDEIELVKIPNPEFGKID